jgi:hypothetical protein
MSYANEQGVPREVEMQRIIQAIPDNTQKYQRYLELSSRPRLATLRSRFRDAGGDRT